MSGKTLVSLGNHQVLLEPLTLNTTLQFWHQNHTSSDTEIIFMIYVDAAVATIRSCRTDPRFITLTDLTIQKFVVQSTTETNRLLLTGATLLTCCGRCRAKTWTGSTSSSGSQSSSCWWRGKRWCSVGFCGAELGYQIQIPKFQLGKSWFSTQTSLNMHQGVIAM